MKNQGSRLNYLTITILLVSLFSSVDQFCMVNSEGCTICFCSHIHYPISTFFSPQ